MHTYTQQTTHTHNSKRIHTYMYLFDCFWWTLLFIVCAIKSTLLLVSCCHTKTCVSNCESEVCTIAKACIINGKNDGYRKITCYTSLVPGLSLYANKKLKGNGLLSVLKVTESEARPGNETRFTLWNWVNYDWHSQGKCMSKW